MEHDISSICLLSTRSRVLDASYFFATAIEIPLLSPNISLQPSRHPTDQRSGTERAAML
jgi:hypothetical protein